MPREPMVATIVAIDKQEEYRWLITLQDSKGKQYQLHLNVHPDQRAPEVGDEVEI